MIRRAAVTLALLLLVLTVAVGKAEAASETAPPADGCAEGTGTCVIALGDSAESDAGAEPASTGQAVTLVFFWAVGCPHCADAKTFLGELMKRRHDFVLESYEVKHDPVGRQRFIETMSRLGVAAPGVPAFVVKDRYWIGFRKGSSERQVEELVDRALGKPESRSARGPPGATSIDLPLIGSIEPRALPLPAFTLVVGLVDGINPCAMYVLLVLLSILVHVRSSRRLALFGSLFVVMSGVVYFLFMTAWTELFELMGLSAWITRSLGAVVLLMGLINLKELVWFKRGVSLTIPESAKPRIYRRMRRIADASSLPFAFVGIAALAFMVNLIELGCTLGLPAVYTRILTLHSELSATGRYLYLVLYNLAYVVPLAVIVAVYTITLRRMTLSERGAKALKAVSGALLVTFGLVLLTAPELLA